LLAAIVTVMSIAAIYLIFRRNKKVSFYLLWFFVTLMPVCNIVPFKAMMAERFLYLPIIGFASLVGIWFLWLYDSLCHRRLLRIALVAAAIMAFTVYAALSVIRNMEWKDEVTFYMKEAVRSPENPKAHYNFGYACAKEAKKDRQDKEFASIYYLVAIGEFQRAISIKPDSQMSYAGLANAYNSVGLYDEAVKNFRKALVFGEKSDVYNNLGVAYYSKKMYEEARVALMKALMIDPDHINASINMGNCYYAKGEFAKAKRMWTRATSLGAGSEILSEKLSDLIKEGY
jgi:protein O-mannosyl-transferase